VGTSLDGHHANRKTRTEEIINSLMTSDDYGICIRDANNNVVSQNLLCTRICGEKMGEECDLCEEGAVSSSFPIDCQHIEGGVGEKRRAIQVQNSSGKMKFFSSYENAALFYKHQIQAAELTSKEKEIVHYILKGKTNAEIKELIKVSKATLKTHLNHIYQKAEFLKGFRRH